MGQIGWGGPSTSPTLFFWCSRGVSVSVWAAAGRLLWWKGSVRCFVGVNLASSSLFPKIKTSPLKPMSFRVCFKKHFFSFFQLDSIYRFPAKKKAKRRAVWGGGGYGDGDGCRELLAVGNALARGRDPPWSGLTGFKRRDKSSTLLLTS